MVFRADRVLAVLQQKREAFVTFDQGLSERREGYRQAMERLCQWSSAEIAEKIAPLDFPGALPTQEWDLYSSWSVPFEQAWTSHEESDEWARSIIKNISTFAVD
ncbi:NurA domain-containing protein, partial [Synechococcus sp. WC101]